MRAQLSGHAPAKKRRPGRRRSVRTWEALALPESATAKVPAEEQREERYNEELDKELLRASQQEYLFVLSLDHTPRVQ